MLKLLNFVKVDEDFPAKVQGIKAAILRSIGYENVMVPVYAVINTEDTDKKNDAFKSDAKRIGEY